MSSYSTVRTDSRIKSIASPVRSTSSRSDTADCGKAIGGVPFSACLAVHTEDLADGLHNYEAAPVTPKPHHSAGRSLACRVYRVGVPYRLAQQALHRVRGRVTGVLCQLPTRAGVYIRRQANPRARSTSRWTLARRGGPR
jgi:hypothetical protein